MNPSTPKPNFGPYSLHYTPQQIARIEALPAQEYLKQVRLWLMHLTLELCQTPGLTHRERVKVINLLVRIKQL
jgi:hypothetical protein